jgi:hypothetical protein
MATASLGSSLGVNPSGSEVPSGCPYQDTDPNSSKGFMAPNKYSRKSKFSAKNDQKNSGENELETSNGYECLSEYDAEISDMECERNSGTKRRGRSESSNSEQANPKRVQRRNHNIAKTLSDKNKQVSRVRAVRLVTSNVQISNFALSKILSSACPNLKLENLRMQKPGAFLLIPSDENSRNKILSLFQIEGNKPAELAEFELEAPVPKTQTKQKEHKPRFYSAIIRGIEPSIHELDIESGLEKQNLKSFTNVKRYVKSDGKVLPLVEVIFSDLSDCQTLICGGFHLGFSRYRVERKLEIPKVVQCYKCQQFGHISKFCSAAPRCLMCGEEHEHKPGDKCMKAIKCANCGGNHVSSYRGCPYFKHAQEVKQDQYVAKSNVIVPGRSFASMAAPRRPPLLPTPQPAPEILQELATSAAKAAIASQTQMEQKIVSFVYNILCSLSDYFRTCNQFPCIDNVLQIVRKESQAAFNFSFTPSLPIAPVVSADLSSDGQK